jgi:DNA mismatch repair protein MutL
MANISIMSEHLSNKIAAGEVVERPASVVKELVENAVDANSSQIEVLIVEGGLQSIKIIDNGEGMDREDSTLAFERHATSKLKSDQDLFRISTLGFRGEALPSIAAVSKLSLETWNGTDEAGTKVVIEGGKMLEIEDAPLRKGTTMEIRELFFNTPARYKYLKTIHTELSHISDYLNRMAMAHPAISFRLVHNDRELLSTSGNGQLQQVIASIYGYATAKQMIYFEASHIDFEVKGYLAKPEITRSNKHYISLVVNGRYIRSYALQQAIIAGYQTLLPIHRFPMAVLSIKMDPTLLDINVHPSKLEVRMSKEQELMSWLEGEIKQRLGKVLLIPQPLENIVKAEKSKYEQPTMRFQLPSDQLPNAEYSPLSFGERNGQTTGKFDHVADPVKGTDQESQDKDGPNMLGQDSLEDIQGIKGQGSQGGLENNMSQKVSAIFSGSKDQESRESNVTGENPNSSHDGIAPQGEGEELEDIEVLEGLEGLEEQIPLLYPLAQLHGTYILAQNEKGLYMIDQHAAQERIWYEFYYKKLNQPVEVNQELLLPIVLECTAGEFSLIKENMNRLAELGLFLEEFGHHSYMIRSHPQWFPSGEEEQLLREIIQVILDRRGKIEWITFRANVATMMSCKQSIKANHYLTQREMEALLEKLRHTSNPFTCPHGRPITVLLSKYDIEKMFKRVM